jgi:hypothetical protein
MVKAGLFPQPPDSVLLESELKELVAKPPYQTKLRSAVVKTPSAWSIDWKDALKQAKCFGFMKDQERDALGDAFNRYRWWDEVKAGNPLTGSETVFHFHPITLILQIAYSSP